MVEKSETGRESLARQRIARRVITRVLGRRVEGAIYSTGQRKGTSTGKWNRTTSEASSGTNVAGKENATGGETISEVTGTEGITGRLGIELEAKEGSTKD